MIAGKTADELYEGYRLLSGPAPLLPKGAYGFNQSKERYGTQAQVMAVAKGYRERHLPCDYLVVDFFYYTKMGQFDFVPQDWPDPSEMNSRLHAMGFHTMISVWPRFAPGSRYYDMLRRNGWFYHLADGEPTTTNGLPGNRTGSNLDMTNPAAASWFWRTIDQTLIDKGFDAIWTDETEPDIPPNGSYYHIGPGTQYFDVYPLFETSAVDRSGRHEAQAPHTTTTGLSRLRKSVTLSHRPDCGGEALADAPALPAFGDRHTSFTLFSSNIMLYKHNIRRRLISRGCPSSIASAN